MPDPREELGPYRVVRLIGRCEGQEIIRYALCTSEGKIPGQWAPITIYTDEDEAYNALNRLIQGPFRVNLT